MAKVVTMGEILLRLTPVHNERLSQGGDLHAYYGGAEANVALSLSKFGHDVSYCSVVPPNDLGEAALRHLKAGGVDTKWVFREGERMGSYYYEQGFSLKQAKVIYDRKFSSVLELPAMTVDWDAVYDHVDVLHTTGITPALSGDMKKFTLLAIQEAKKRNVQVSFDFNYRGKLWSVGEARAAFLEILPYVDICFAGQSDFVHLLGNDGPDVFDETYLEKCYQRTAEQYGITYFSCTNRTVYSASHNAITGFFFIGDKLYKSSHFTFEILDRIGGGDAFAAGILHGILFNNHPQKVAEFGTAASVMKHFVKGDYNSFSAEEVQAFLRGQSGDVNR